MRRPTTPLWLTTPSRFAGLSTRAAQAVLAAIAALILASLLALNVPGPPPVTHDAANRAEDQADVVLYETIVENVRHGGSYYPVTADALRHGDYPLKPFVTFRLPTLAMVQARMPHEIVVALVYILAAAVALAWYARLASVFARAPPRIVAMTLLAGGMMAFVQADLAPFHEVWAGLFVALSLALRRPGDWIAAVAFGLAAVLIRETAAPYLMLMAALALAEGHRREFVAWLIPLGVLGVALGLHAHAVDQVIRPLDPASPGWAGMLGFGFFVRTMTISTALGIAPQWLAAPLVALALAGWAGWRDPLGVRVVLLLAGYALILSIVGRTDTFYWGLLVAPVSLVGLAFVPDALRDLVGAALDKRRITVTRVVR